MKKSNLILLAILILAIVLRFWQLGQVPTILNRDEAALAYNALLLKETGKDEWSRRWPVILESFGDDKLIGYPLTLIGSFFLFGYSDWAVKLPAAIAGVVLVWLAYLWAKNIFRWETKWALCLSLLVALQPVLFFFSRIAFEANLALALFVASLLLLFNQQIQTVKWRLLSDIVAGFLLLAAVFIYNTPLLLLPFFIPLVTWWRGIKKPKLWFPAVLVIMTVILIGGTTLLSLSQQKSGITIFSDEDTWFAFVKYHDSFSGLTQKVVGNKVAFYGQIIAQHYWQTLGPVFLVERGGTHPWHQLPGWGHLFWITYLLGLVGILAALINLIKIFWQKKWAKLSENQNKLSLLLLAFLLVTPLPAAITVDAPHATRSLFFFVVWLMWSVIGLQLLFTWAQKYLPKFSKLVIGIFLFILFVESTNYYFHYFRDYPAESTAILRGNFAPALTQITSDQKVQKAAIIDDGGYQYILAAWYLKMSPNTFFATVQKQLPDKIGFRYGYKLGKFRFIKQPEDRFKDEKTLLEWDSSLLQWIRKDL